MKSCKGILIAVMLAIISSFTFGEDETSKPFKLIMSENMLEKKDNLIDINSASKEEMVSIGIGIGFVGKILS